MPWEFERATASAKVYVRLLLVEESNLMDMITRHLPQVSKFYSSIKWEHQKVERFYTVISVPHKTACIELWFNVTPSAFMYTQCVNGPWL